MTTSPTVGNNGSGGTSLSGLVSGIDTTSIINELMTIAAQPQQQLEGQRSTDQGRVQTYQALNTAVQTVGTDAMALATPVGWNVFAATTSDDTVATATTGAGAAGGNLTFTVNNLATSSALISSASVAALTTPVTTGNLLLSQAGGLGFSAVAGDQTLTTGTHTLTVTQATTGASVTGSSLVAPSTTIVAGTNDTLQYTVDGNAHSLTIAAGSYTPTQLAAAVAAASGGNLSAQVNGSGQLALSTTSQGSAHSMTVTGGDGLSTLGLVAGSSGTGTDGAVSVDGGPSVTVSDAHAGASVSLTSGSGGTVTATLSGGLVAGTTTLTNVSTRSGDLTDVVNAVNSSGANTTATAVQTGGGGYRLQLSSNGTGAASDLTIAPTAFNGTLGNLNVLQAGTDASITVGTGVNAYQVTSATNSVTGVMPGVTIGLVKASTTPVTVSVASDTTTLGNQVQSMVNDINTVISQAKSATQYDPNGQTTGPLIGDSVVESLGGGLIAALTSEVAGASLQDASAVGITVGSNGMISFDSSKFTDALTANPQAVSALFQQTSGGGIAQQLQTYADSMSNPAKGAITTEIQGTQSDITDLNNQISAWTPLLTQQQQQLTNQFNAMETTLAQLESQSAALTALGG